MNIRTVLNSGEVVRFHSHVGIEKQKISEHQWGVALIVEHLFPECSKKLILAALTHDAAEYYTGDIPFNAKQEDRTLKEILDRLEDEWKIHNGVDYTLTPVEEIVLKLADVLEGMRYCVLQVRIGNINAKRPFRKWDAFFLDYCDNNCYEDNSLLCEIIENAKSLYLKIKIDMEMLINGKR